MKKLIFTVTICLISLSCVAQQTIKTTQRYNGKQIPYITFQTFSNLKINNTVTIGAITKVQSVKDIIDLLGEPTDIKNEKDIAIDGTVLFETKMLKYPGLLVVFSKKDGKYKLSRIDFISDNFSKKIYSNEISVGMTLHDISGFSSKIKQLSSNGIVSIAVKAADSAQELGAENSGNIKFSDKYMKIMYDTATGRIEKISIFMYSI